MKGLRCSVRHRDGHPVVRVRGRLTSETGPRLHSAVLGAQIADGEDAEIVVDLTRLEYFDSEGLTEVLGLARMSRRRGGTVTVVGLDEAVARITDLSGLPAVPVQRTSVG